jgi:recombination protein RecA
MDLAVDLDIVKKSGSWFSYNGQKLGQGRDNAKAKIFENEELRKEIEAKIMEHIEEIDLSSSETDEEAAAEEAKEVLEAADTAPAEEAAPVEKITAVTSPEDIDADDDFEEFDPA